MDFISHQSKKGSVDFHLQPPSTTNTSALLSISNVCSHHCLPGPNRSSSHSRPHSLRRGMRRCLSCCGFGTGLGRMLAQPRCGPWASWGCCRACPGRPSTRNADAGEGGGCFEAYGAPPRWWKWNHPRLRQRIGCDWSPIEEIWPNQPNASMDNQNVITSRH